MTIDYEWGKITYVKRKLVINMYCVNIPELRAEMGRQNLSVSALSRKMGVSRETVNNVLKGQNPTYPFICKSIDALGITKGKALDIFFAPKLT